MSNEIKKCPFCAGIKCQVIKDMTAFLNHCCSIVACSDCGATGPNKPTEQEAIEAWSRRATANEETCLPIEKDKKNIPIELFNEFYRACQRLPVGPMTAKQIEQFNLVEQKILEYIN